MMGDENLHKCRDPPFEAAIYNLKAEGEKLEKFRANSEIELTIEVNESSEQQGKKQEHSSLELPLDFSQEDVARVRIMFPYTNIPYNFYFTWINKLERMKVNTFLF